jgi:hypothetical protein
MDEYGVASYCGFASFGERACVLPAAGPMPPTLLLLAEQAGSTVITVKIVRTVAARFIVTFHPSKNYKTSRAPSYCRTKPLSIH